MSRTSRGRSRGTGPWARRARELAGPVVGVVGFAAALVTVIGFFDDRAGGGVAGESSGPATPASTGPLVVIAAATVNAGPHGQALSYEVEGKATGVTDPPWKLFIIAEPKGPASDTAAAGEPKWMVSTEVTPNPDGTWIATLAGDLLPLPSSGVKFQPVLVGAPPSPQTQPPVMGEVPTPTRSGFPGPVTLPPIDTTGPIEDALEDEGPSSPLVDFVFDPFDLVTRPASS